MEKWNEVLEKFSHVTDRLGKPIDTGILDTVVALNMLGITTIQSCEGHLDRGLAYPWIDIETQEYKLLRQNEPAEIRELQIKIAKLREQVKCEEMPAVQDLKRKAKQTDLQQRYKLHLLLAEFYKDRHPTFDRMITFSLSARIRSQGGDFLELLSPDEQMQKLREYQDEMTAFTDFLKSRIVSELMK